MSHHNSIGEQSASTENRPQGHAAHMEALRAFVAEKNERDGTTYWPEAGDGEPEGFLCHYFYDLNSIEFELAKSYGIYRYLRSHTLSLPALRYIVTRDCGTTGQSHAVTSNPRDFSSWSEDGINVMYVPTVRDAQGREREQGAPERLQLKISHILDPVLDAVCQADDHASPSSDSHTALPSSSVGVLPLPELLPTPPPHPTVIFVTGSGASGKFIHEGYLRQIKNALEIGLRVKLWGWKHRLLSSYFRVQKKYPDLLEIHYFDEYTEYLISCTGIQGCLATGSGH
ncbi:hypothetical protein BOTBODRAFT_174756 [Botryobasidium botryosum FD-172 SS1]|uniref:Uncharacterized protein n=1 Tax=Botryobasidium botryosum (strain FD-172 SS1) TaxID=930990 RepID=A0A067MFJ9_BOTB1|nr:hypothetical protein BOTBODRAFT_174756 [Botryobasidium botryosum FD-172 SS1]